MKQVKDGCNENIKVLKRWKKTPEEGRTYHILGLVGSIKQC